MKTLIREKDNSKWQGQIEFIKFGKSTRAKEVITSPTVGWNCIVNRTLSGETFMTSEIVEVINNDNFKTAHSNYKIEIHE